MVFDKIPKNTVLQVRSDKTNGSRIEPFDVEEDRKSEHANYRTPIGAHTLSCTNGSSAL